MSDVKRLLNEASPLPWSQDEFDLYLTDAEGEPVHWDHEGLGATWGKDANPQLILHAVNHLPEYEAAMDALEYIERRLRPVDPPRRDGHEGRRWADVDDAYTMARGARRRVRGDA